MAEFVLESSKFLDVVSSSVAGKATLELASGPLCTLPGSAKIVGMASTRHESRLKAMGTGTRLIDG